MGEAKRRREAGEQPRSELRPTAETFAANAAFLREIADAVGKGKSLAYVLVPGDPPVVYHPAGVPAEAVIRSFKRVQLKPYREVKPEETPKCSACGGSGYVDVHAPQGGVETCPSCRPNG